MKREPARGGFTLVARPQREQKCQIHICLHIHGECGECFNSRVDEGGGGNGHKGAFHKVRRSHTECDGVT